MQLILLLKYNLQRVFARFLSCSSIYGLVQHSTGILTQSSVDNHNTPKHGPNFQSKGLNTSAQALSNSKDIIFSRSKPSELLVDKSAACIDADYEYVNM
jgi:myb proto-oncogene protein